MQEDDTDDDCAIAICRDVDPSDVDYIAACNPAAMTAVLAHIEEQDTELAAYETAIAEYRQQCIDNYAAVQIAEARHAQELAAYELTVANQRAELAQPECKPDCRTCRRFISGGDGCTTVVSCTSGDQYKPTAPVYFWEKP